MKEMYKGKVNSPATLLVETIDSSVTSIKVADGTVFPEGPNVAVIGTDGNAETIKYDSINGNILVGCVRGFQGKASVWDKDTIIARNFTEYDLDALQENILELDKNKVDKIEGKNLSSNDFTDDLKNKLEKIEDGANKVTKISQLINDKTFKTESEIQSLINNSTKLKKEVVTSLPSTGKEDVIYLLKNKNDTNNYYTEYMWISGKWEIIGDTNVDLTDYAKKSEIKNSLSEMTSDSTHRTVTDDEKKKWNNKVDTVAGKGLSTNDFTDEDKAKVDAIPLNPKYTDTITKIAGKTGDITKEDLESLGIGGISEDEAAAISLKLIYTDYLFSDAKDLYNKLNLASGTNFSPTIKTTDNLVNSDVATKELINNELALSWALKSVSFTDKMSGSSTAMNAVANSSTAMNAVANSSTAMNAVANSSTAMNAVANSSTAMNAVLNSSTAMNAVANSSTAMNTIQQSPQARIYKSDKTDGRYWRSGLDVSSSGVLAFAYIKAPADDEQDPKVYPQLSLQINNTNPLVGTSSFVNRFIPLNDYFRNTTNHVQFYFSGSFVLIYRIK